jgi:hypothetical protein
MSNNIYSTMLEAIIELKKRGYYHSMNVLENRLYCFENKHIYAPEEMRIVEFHRFEGDGDYNDNSIIYVIEAEDGTKAIIIDAYGTYANVELYHCIQKMKSSKLLESKFK